MGPSTSSPRPAPLGLCLTDAPVPRAPLLSFTSGPVPSPPTPSLTRPDYCTSMSQADGYPMVTRSTLRTLLQIRPREPRASMAVGVGGGRPCRAQHRLQGRRCGVSPSRLLQPRMTSLLVFTQIGPDQSKI